MAKDSKSRNSKDKNSKPDEAEGTDEAEIQHQENAESTDTDAPVVIEAEVVEETEAVETPSTDDTNGITNDDPVDTSEPVMAAPAPVVVRRGSVLPLLVGGLAAGGIGYLAATYVNPPPAPVDTSAITNSVAETDTRLDALSTELSELKAAPAALPDLSSIEDQIAGIATKLEDVDTDIAMLREEVSGVNATIDEKTGALSERLTVLETADGEEAAEATQEELAAFRAELDRMTSEAQARVADAQAKATEVEQAAAQKAAEAEQAAAEAEQKAAEAAVVAKRQAAIVELKAALESGKGFDDILPAIGDVPDVLTANSANGVPTLVSIQQAFPDAARDALSVAETAPQDASTGEKLTAFLKRQTNARSLKPIEGNGTDAVLSRAEARLKQGDLPAALSELDGLPDGSKAAMQGWLDQATTRTAAVRAAAELSVTN